MLLLLAPEQGAQMSVGFIYWLLMILWLIFGFVWYWPRGDAKPAYPNISGHFMLFVLLFLLGLSVYGFPIG